MDCEKVFISGVVFAHFVFWYAFLCIFVSQFREYRAERVGLGAGQVIKFAMSILGLTLLVLFHRKKLTRVQSVGLSTGKTASEAVMDGWVLGRLVLFCLTIQSDWTQDIPVRYGERHPGLGYLFSTIGLRRGLALE